MTDQKKYVHYYGQLPTNLPPDVKVVRMDHALVGGLTFAIFFFFMTLLLVWRDLPILGISPDSLKLHIKFWFKIAIHSSNTNFFEDETSQYKNWLLQVPFVHFYGRILVSAFVGAFVGGWIAKLFATPRDQFIHVAGGQVAVGADASKIASLITKGIKPFMFLHPFLGLIKEEWTRHILIYGGVGGGKTVILLGILKQIFKENHKAIIYDSKGDYTSKFSNALLVSPWDARSFVWDIAKDIDTDSAIRSFANSLFPTKAGDKNAFFQQAAAAILIAIIYQLYDQKKGKWSWGELDKLVSQPHKKLLQCMKSYNPSQANVIEDEKSQATSSVLGTFSNGVLVINQLARAWGSNNNNPRLSFKEWLQDDYAGTRQIILQGGKDAKLQSSYIAAIFNAIIPEIISPAFKDNELGRSLFFIIDEFPTVGKIEIPPLVALGRSKGCMVLLGFQDIAQVKEIYGDEFARALPAMVGTQIVCRIGAGETRQKVYHLVGKRRVATMQNNISSSGGQQSVSSSYNEQERDLICESDLTTALGLRAVSQSALYPIGKAIRALIMSGDKLLMLDYPVEPIADTRSNFEEAAWCKSVLSNPDLVKAVEKIVDPCIPRSPSAKMVEAVPSSVLASPQAVKHGSPQAIAPSFVAAVQSSSISSALNDDERVKADKEEAERLEEELAESNKKYETSNAVTSEILDVTGVPDPSEIYGEGEIDKDESEDIFGGLGVKMFASAFPGGDLLLEACDIHEGMQVSRSNQKLRFKQQTSLVLS